MIKHWVILLKPGFLHFYMEKWYITNATRIPRYQEQGGISQKPGARSQEETGPGKWGFKEPGAASKEVPAARIAVISLLDLQEVLFPDGWLFALVPAPAPDPLPAPVSYPVPPHTPYIKLLEFG